MRIVSAILAGFFAAVGSIFGKFSAIHDKLSKENEWALTFALVFILLMLAFSAVGVLFYMKALHEANSTVAATLISAAGNFLFSGIFGYVIFQERLSVFWWFGTLFNLLGLYVITFSIEKPVTVESKKTVKTD